MCVVAALEQNRVVSVWNIILVIMGWMGSSSHSPVRAGSV